MPYEQPYNIPRPQPIKPNAGFIQPGGGSGVTQPPRYGGNNITPGPNQTPRIGPGPGPANDLGRGIVEPKQGGYPVVPNMARNMQTVTPDVINPGTGQTAAPDYSQWSELQHILNARGQLGNNAPQSGRSFSKDGGVPGMTAEVGIPSPGGYADPMGFNPNNNYNGMPGPDNSQQGLNPNGFNGQQQSQQDAYAQFVQMLQFFGGQGGQGYPGQQNHGRQNPYGQSPYPQSPYQNFGYGPMGGNYDLPYNNYGYNGMNQPTDNYNPWGDMYYESTAYPFGPESGYYPQSQMPQMPQPSGFIPKPGLYQMGNNPRGGGDLMNNFGQMNQGPTNFGGMRRGQVGNMPRNYNWY